MFKRGPSWPGSLATTQALWFPALQDVADNTIISSAQKFPGWGHLFCSYASINRSIGIFRADISSWYFLYPAQVALLKVYRWTSLSIKAFIPDMSDGQQGKGYGCQIQGGENCASCRFPHASKWDQDVSLCCVPGKGHGTHVASNPTVNTY